MILTFSVSSLPPPPPPPPPAPSPLPLSSHLPSPLSLSPFPERLTLQTNKICRRQAQKLSPPPTLPEVKGFDPQVSALSKNRQRQFLSGVIPISLPLSRHQGDDRNRQSSEFSPLASFLLDPCPRVESCGAECGSPPRLSGFFRSD